MKKVCVFLAGTANAVVTMVRKCAEPELIQLLNLFPIKTKKIALN